MLTLSRRNLLRGILVAATLPTILGGASPRIAGTADDPVPGSYVDALRRLDKPNLVVTEVETIQNSTHRVVFSEAIWDGGATFVRDLFIKTAAGWKAVTTAAQRFDEQWIVFTDDDAPAPLNYYYSPGTTSHWLGFTSLAKLNATTVELTTAVDGQFDLTVRWSLDAAQPELQYVLTASAAQHYVVGYQSVDIREPGDIDEVLCGALQHARVIGGPAALGAWELFAPMSLAQQEIGGENTTVGVFVPGDVMEFVHERQLGSDRQPFGMSLRNDDGGVQPTIYAPQAGLNSAMSVGESVGFSFGVLAAAGDLYSSYRDLSIGSYGYTAYRRNVWDTSLTDTVHNLIALAAVDAPADDSIDFGASFSGWWSRAKGWIDVENDQAVRTTVASTLLSAHYLTSTPGSNELYDSRARPLAEYHVSRRSIGSTPIVGKDVYGDSTATVHALGGAPGDASTLVPLHRMLKRHAAGVHHLAEDLIDLAPGRDARSPWSTAMQAWVLTGDQAWLTEAVATAKRYAATEIDRAYTTNLIEIEFGHNYVKRWIELFVLWELTADPILLAAAQKEARRYVTLMQIRPVPSGDVIVPATPIILNQFDDWPGSALPAYPRSAPPTETVPAWIASTTGLTFEQLSTFKIGDSTTASPAGGFVLIGTWAPFLLRLAAATNDAFLSDVAHNLVVGRYTNYPGYYSRQLSAAETHPDFPMQGPAGLTCVYFHHILAQLALTMDYLFSEHEVRSGRRVRFPREFESNYAYFKFSTYGAAPGVFHGDQAVWPWFPPGIISVNNKQINWLTAVGNGKFYVSLTNESTTAETATVVVATALTGISASGTRPAEIVSSSGARSAVSISGGSIQITVPARGQIALVIPAVSITVPWHWQPELTDRADLSWAIDGADSATRFGGVRGMLIPRPSRDGVDAYVQATTDQPSTLTWSINGGAPTTTPAKPHPQEWTIPLAALTDRFTYSVTTAGAASPQRTLRLPSSVTRRADVGASASGTVHVPPTTTAGDTIAVTVDVVANTSTLTQSAISLALPSGWASSVVEALPATVMAGRAARARYNVVVPAGSAEQSFPLGAQLTFAGGTVDLVGVRVRVDRSIKMMAFTVEPGRVASPGTPATATVAILNRGAASQSGQVRVFAGAGLTVTDGTRSWTIPARTEQEFTFTASTATSAQPGRYELRAELVGFGVQAKAAFLTVNNPNEVVVSNDAIAPAYRETGTWLASSLVGFEGKVTRYSPENVLGGTATWQPTLPSDGTYEISVWYPTNSTTTTAAEYTVTDSAGPHIVLVDQQQNANGWRVLGSYACAAGSSNHVVLRVVQGPYTRASAVRFLRTGPI